MTEENYSGTLHRGQELAWSGNWEEAALAFQEALSEVPQDPLAHSHLGMAYSHLGRYQEALAEYLAVLRTLPGDTLALRRVTELRKMLGLPTREVSSATEDKLLRAGAARAAGQPKEAIQLYEEVFHSLQPDSAEGDALNEFLWVCSRLMDTYQEVGEEAKAYETAELTIKFLEERGWGEWAEGLREQLEDMIYASSGAHWEELRETPPEIRPKLLEALARSEYHLRGGRLLAAIDECYAALTLQPSFLPLHEGLGKLYAASGKKEEALEKYRTLARLYQAQGQAAEASRAFGTILTLDPRDQQSRVSLALLLDAQGDQEAALKERLLAVEGYLSSGEVEGAIKLLMEAKQGRQDWEIVHVKLAQAYYLQERMDAALEELEALAALCIARGEKEKAKGIREIVADLEAPLVQGRVGSDD